ncbi:MAG: cytochrome c biogenesis protein CcsA [Coriobacteriia bacterium]
MTLIVEVVIMSGAVLVYAIASMGFVVALMFGKKQARLAGIASACAGLVLHAVAILGRWVRVGHGPAVGFYEVASLLGFLTVAFFLPLLWRQRGLWVVGVGVMPLAFLLLGGAMLAGKEAQGIEGSLVSYWLGIHVAFANLAYGAYAASFALAIAFLLREKGSTRFATVLAKLPDQLVIDGLMFKFVGAGFLFQGIMIVSGAIWANEAWGRYWAWDPMETWSLIAWMIYAGYLHVRLTLGWSGSRAAWIAVFSLPVIVFTLLGVPNVYKTIHGAYLQR